MGDIREALRELRRTYASQSSMSNPLDLASVRKAHLALQRGEAVPMDLALIVGIGPELDKTEGDDTGIELEKAREAAIRGGKPQKPVIVIY